MNLIIFQTYDLDKSQYKTDGTKSKVLKYMENGKSNSRLNSDTPPLSPLSQRDSNDEVSIMQKVEFKTEEVDGVFEVYYERNRDMLEDEYPDASEHDIKRYLRKTWDSMNSSFRKKYRSYVTSDTTDTHIKENSSDHEEDLLIDIDVNTKDNKKSRIKAEKEEICVTETKRSRPYNLFKGMKQEKVCQICEKTGKLTRCKGPCYSYFHLSCVKPGESSPEHSIDESTMDDKILNDIKEIKGDNIDEDETTSGNEIKSNI